MSFITKRERVFNENELLTLPSRNEGKLKAYSSCTDARAWSHFCSDKTEHLVEVIKRNNDTCAPKYVPTKVIVDTIMVSKNAEIGRLKRKIEQLEQMLAVYDDIELDCAKKCEIAKAHEAIRAANKELDEMCLDLDLSGFTEGMDSDAYETGKSRGDETARSGGDQSIPSEPISTPKQSTPRTESRAIQRSASMSCVCDATTNATDPRLDEMKDEIISKDAKLNAMQNTIAVMESDVCEPFCIYAHIYTALEKIFGILYQNDKYKQYLELLTCGKDTRCIDIKGKIFFKMKVLEKFCLALIAPCSQEMRNNSGIDCSCYRAEILARVENTFALTTSEHIEMGTDKKRAELVAEIMENDEMKEILYKGPKTDESQTDDGSVVDNYSIDNENLQRLKDLQTSYDELMLCYENLKHEKDCLSVRCQKYQELEIELEHLRVQLRSYNCLYKEKEFYRLRSADLDALKEKYLVLYEETTNLECKLKSEEEINFCKCKSIEELRSENVKLEKKINDLSLAFEKEKNSLLCKLKEAECKLMCKDHEVRSLSQQIDKHLDESQDPSHNESTIVLINEIESLKDQIRNLKDLVLCCEDDKRKLQDQFQDKLSLINDLRMEIEDWKSKYEKTLNRNIYLEKYAENFRDELNVLEEENKTLSQSVNDKTKAVDNLMDVINTKSAEINKLLDEIEKEKIKNKELLDQLQDVNASFSSNLTSVKSDKNEAISKLNLEKKQSRELLTRVNDFEQLLHEKDDLNKKLKESLSSSLHEIQKLHDANENAMRSMNSMQDERNEFKHALQLARKKSDELHDKVKKYEGLANELETLKTELEVMNEEKKTIENELNRKSLQLETAMSSIELVKTKSEIKLINIEQENEHLKKELQNLKERYRNDLDVINQEKASLDSELKRKSLELENAISSMQLVKTKSEIKLINTDQENDNLKKELQNLNEGFRNVLEEKDSLTMQLSNKTRDLDNLKQSINEIKNENENLLQVCRKVPELERELENLKNIFEETETGFRSLQNDYSQKSEELQRLQQQLLDKVNENNCLLEQINSLKLEKSKSDEDFDSALKDKIQIRKSLDDVHQQNIDLKNKLREYNDMQLQIELMKQEQSDMIKRNDALKSDLDNREAQLKQLEKENNELNNQATNLLTHNDDLEKALINTRNELLNNFGRTDSEYENLIKEVEEIKNEKMASQKKIRDLLDNVEENEAVISNLGQDVLTRDDRISLLENHINELEDEIRQLHNNLEYGLRVGEQLRDSGVNLLDNSLKKMEAHHSKATHNMKMEITKLQNEKLQLTEQLSSTKLRGKESVQDKHKNISQIMQLQYEQDIIAREIKNLEVKCMGDSELSPNECELDDILQSIKNINKYLDTKTSQNNNLESTLLKYQSSSQLLLSKAEEAKKIAENEIQKINNEKEEAIKDRQNLEKKMAQLKTDLEKEISTNKEIIKDLESEVLNQKLIIEKINVSTQTYIQKLEDEMENLQNMYKKASSMVDNLQLSLDNASEENKHFKDLLEKAHLNLDEKIDEISSLQITLNDIKNKPKENREVQTAIIEAQKTASTQTNQKYNIEDKIDSPKIMKIAYEKELDVSNRLPDDAYKNPVENNTLSNLLNQRQTNDINEVQILTANVEPTFDFVRNSYRSYKIKNLDIGPLEQHSISSFDENIDRSNKSDESIVDTTNIATDTELIDLYKRKAKAFDEDNKEEQMDKHSDRWMEYDKKRSVYSSLDQNGSHSRFNTKSISNDSSPDRDLFVFYSDSEPKSHKKPETKQKAIKLQNSSKQAENKAHDNKYKTRNIPLDEYESENNKMEQPDDEVNWLQDDKRDGKLKTRIIQPGKDKPVKNKINQLEDNVRWQPNRETDQESREIPYKTRIIQPDKKVHDENDIDLPADSEQWPPEGIKDNKNKIKISKSGTNQSDKNKIEHPQDKAHLLPKDEAGSKNKTRLIQPSLNKHDKNKMEISEDFVHWLPEDKTDSKNTTDFIQPPKNVQNMKKIQLDGKTHWLPEEKRDNKNKIVQPGENEPDRNKMEQREEKIHWLPKEKRDNKNKNKIALSGKNEPDKNKLVFFSTNTSKLPNDEEKKRNNFDDFSNTTNSDADKILDLSSRTDSKKVKSDTDTSDKNSDMKATTPSLPSISNNYPNSQYSLDIASDEDTIKRLMNKHNLPLHTSDTDDDKLKKRENQARNMYTTDSELTDKYQSEENNVLRYNLSPRTVVDTSETKTTKAVKDYRTKEKYPSDFGLEYILETVKRENPDNITRFNLKSLRKSQSDLSVDQTKTNDLSDASTSKMGQQFHTSSNEEKSSVASFQVEKTFVDFSVNCNIDSTDFYLKKIKQLTKTLENAEKDHKMKIDAIKIQYDSNIKHIINQHNQGVQSMQGLHEETLQDIMKIHENEVENLRSMSIEAMRKAEKLEKERSKLMNKVVDVDGLDKEPTKMAMKETKKRKVKSRDSKTLTQTSVEAFNVKPKQRALGPCTCSLDVNISDTIRNIFEQVDVEQRKMAEFAYMKYIANKMTNGNVDVLDSQELSFLHYNVCRTWKTKLSKEQALQKRIGSLETELIHKQRNAQQHIAELDRKVAEERRRLQEVREAVCHNATSVTPRAFSPSPSNKRQFAVPAARPNTAAEKDVGCHCDMDCACGVQQRKSAGDLLSAAISAPRQKRVKPDINRAVLAKLDLDDRRADRRICGDELPTRLRRDRPSARAHRK